MRAGAINGLRDAPLTIVILRAKLVGGDRRHYRFKDRIRQLLVKESRLQKSEWFQILLVKHVVVIGVRWFEIGIADVNLKGAVPLRVKRRGKVAEIWPGDSPAVGDPN